jgi:hypothetical protein
LALWTTNNQQTVISDEGPTLNVGHLQAILSIMAEK